MEVIDKLINKIKNHPIKVALIVLAFFLIPLLFIQILYSFSIPFFESHWSAGDLLGYYASFVATLGTIALSLVAVWLSYTIAEIEKIREEKNRIADISAAKAELNLKEINYSYAHTDTVLIPKNTYIQLSIANMSSNMATDVQILNPVMFLKNETMPIPLIPDRNNKNFIDKAEIAILLLYGFGNSRPESNLSFTLYYKDTYQIHRTDYEARHSDNVNNIWDIDKQTKQPSEPITK